MSLELYVGTTISVVALILTGAMSYATKSNMFLYAGLSAVIPTMLMAIFPHKL